MHKTPAKIELLRLETDWVNAKLLGDDIPEQVGSLAQHTEPYNDEQDGNPVYK